MSPEEFIQRVENAAKLYDITNQNFTAKPIALDNDVRTRVAKHFEPNTFQQIEETIFVLNKQKS